MWLSSGSNLGGEISRSRRKDRYLTGLLYIQQEGVGWNKTENWLTEESLCTWEGVFCDDEESVIGVDVEDNNLQGQVRVEVNKTFVMSQLLLTIISILLCS